MKSKDIGLIVVIAIISAGASVLLSSFLISSEDKKQSVEVVTPITSEFTRPPSEYFNSDSINPTQEIKIEEDPDSNPFEGR